MKILWFAPSDMLMEPVISGLQSLEEHELRVCHFDRVGVPPDRAMLDAADQFQPALVLYTGQVGGPFKPDTYSLLQLRRRWPTVLLVHDATDKDWAAPLDEYREKEAFTVTVNIDGNRGWEKGPRDFTALTPIDPRFYRDVRPHTKRPISFGFAGGYASPSRAEIINYLIEHCGLVVPSRQETYGTYQAYADFMLSCKIILNVPFSGHDTGSQVKGRVIEAGWARCALMEHDSAPTREWFKDSFWEYSGKKDAERLLSSINSNWPVVLERINRFSEQIYEHHPNRFWPKVFERAL